MTLRRREYLVEDDHLFCKSEYNRVMKSVKENVSKDIIDSAWAHITKTGARKIGEFYIGKKVFWYGQVDCIYDAKTKGWLSYLDKQGIK